MQNSYCQCSVCVWANVLIDFITFRQWFYLYHDKSETQLNWQFVVAITKNTNLKHAVKKKTYSKKSILFILVWNIIFATFKVIVCNIQVNQLHKIIVSSCRPTLQKLHKQSCNSDVISICMCYLNNTMEKTLTMFSFRLLTSVVVYCQFPLQNRRNVIYSVFYFLISFICVKLHTYMS